MKKVIGIFITILLLVGLSCTAFAASSNVGVEAGDSMPDFTVELTDGTSITLSEVLKEKDLVVLNVFATWCGPCKVEFPEMDKSYQAHSDQMELISVSGDVEDTMEMVADYKEENKLTFPMGLAGNALDFLDIPGYPTTIFIDRDGKVGFIKVGAFVEEGEFESKVNHFLSSDYDGNPLDSEVAKSGLTPILIAVIVGTLALFVIGRWLLFRKAGRPGWHSIIPLLSTYEEYKLCWSGAVGIFSVLCSIGLLILGYFTTRNQSNLEVIALGAIGFVYFVVSLIESVKLAKAYGKGIIYGIFLIIFKSVGRFILGLSKAQYQRS